jgi:hypothetical protein
MTLNEDSRLLRFAYFYFPEDRPDGGGYRNAVSLCGLFWRCVGTVLISTLFAFIAGALLTAGYQFVTHVNWKALKDVLIVIGMVVGAVTLILGSVWFTDKITKPPSADDGVFFLSLKALKKHYCPLITIISKEQL